MIFKLRRLFNKTLLSSKSADRRFVVLVGLSEDSNFPDSKWFMMMLWSSIKYSFMQYVVRDIRPHKRDKYVFCLSHSVGVPSCSCESE